MSTTRAGRDLENGVDVFGSGGSGATRAWLRDEFDRLPRPGGGHTAERFEQLARLGRRSLSQAKVFESHVDAQAILAEAGMAAPGGLGAVWASDGPPGALRLSDVAGRLSLSGCKPFCSGVAVVDWALVTCRDDRQNITLALVDVRDARVEPGESTWVGHGMRRADTRPVVFDAAPVERQVGPPNWYVSRPGFWHGAVGVASCWFGGALGLADTLRAAVDDEPHALADLGSVEAELYAMRAALTLAVREIDDAPDDTPSAHRRALEVRAVVERGCRAVLDSVAVALGPRPLAFDADHSQRVSDLQVYLRQHHGRRDLEALGRLTRQEGEAPC